MRIPIESRSGGVAVFVPDSVAVHAGLRGGEMVDVEVTDGRLIVRPVRPASLMEMLSRITPENLHTEWVAGPPAGVEIL